MNSLQKQQIIQNDFNYLRALLKPGDTVYTILRHVSPSGMSRVISLIAIHDNQPRCIDSYVVSISDYRYDPRHSGLKIGGGGMDMGFHLVYSLSSALFHGGFDCIGPDCPSNDHMNGDRDYSPHRHSDGGYALLHSWL